MGKFFHGTNDETPILEGQMEEGSWLTPELSRAMAIAIRRAEYHGGKPIVFELAVPPESCAKDAEHEVDLDMKFAGGFYRVLGTWTLVYTKL